MLKLNTKIYMNGSDWFRLSLCEPDVFVPFRFSMFDERCFQADKALYKCLDASPCRLCGENRDG